MPAALSMAIHRRVFEAREAGETTAEVADGPINGDSFKADVQQVEAAVIRPGDLVILNNLSSYKTALVRRSREDNGARTRYLPPYKPVLNPTEKRLLETQMRGQVNGPPVASEQLSETH